MLDALKTSNEPDHLVQAATRYLKGLKGNLVQLKKQKAIKEHAAKEEAAAAAFQQYQQAQSYQSFSNPQGFGGGQGQGYATQNSGSHGFGGGQPQPYGQAPYRQGGTNAGPGFYSTSGWMG